MMAKEGRVEERIWIVSISEEEDQHFTNGKNVQSLSANNIDWKKPVWPILCFFLLNHTRELTDDGSVVSALHGPGDLRRI